MELHVDFVTPETGRVLLHTAFDAPSNGFNRRECQKLITFMRRTRERLAQVFNGLYEIRVTYDSYDSTLFWTLLFFRPIVFDVEDPWFGGRPWNVYQLLSERRYAKKLQEMNLGIVYDPENNWLILACKEAEKGILADMDAHPSWKKLLDEYEHRTGSPAPAGWWKTRAAQHAFTIAPEKLRRLGYLKKMLWHRPDHGHDDIIVFDLAGMDIVGLVGEVSDVAGNVLNPNIQRMIAKRARFIHFYTDDKRGFSNIRNLKNQKTEPLYRPHAVIQVEKKREEKKIKYAAWIAASAAVCVVAKRLGRGRAGKQPLYLSGKASQEMFHLLAGMYKRSELKISPGDRWRWSRINEALDELEKAMEDDCVPREYVLWFKWRDYGVAVEAMTTEDAEMREAWDE